MPKPQREEAGSLSKYERQKLQRLHKQGGAAFGSERNLVIATNLPVSKVRQFLQIKTSYAKLILPTRKFKRIRSFARFKSEVWCMELAYVDKVAIDNNGVKIYKFVKTCLIKPWMQMKQKQNIPKKPLAHFLLRLQKTNRPKKYWVDKGTESAGRFRKLCQTDRIEVYSTMSENKANFAERTIGSLKVILHHYMEDFKCNYLH